MGVELDVVCDDQVPETARGAEVVCDQVKQSMLAI